MPGITLDISNFYWHAKQETTGRTEGGEGKKKGGGDKTPRPKAPKAGKHAKQDTTGAKRGEEGEKKQEKQKKTQQQPQTGQPLPGGGRTSKERTKNGQVTPGRPARPTRPSGARTRTHAQDPGVASSDPKGVVSASTRNSPGAPAESPVARRTVLETGSVSDRVHTRQTTAAHAAQDRSPRDPPGTTPSRGPERVRRGARPAPLPRQGPAAGTMSLVLGRPPRPHTAPTASGKQAPAARPKGRVVEGGRAPDP